MKPSLYSTLCSQAPMHRSLARFVILNMHKQLSKQHKIEKCLPVFICSGSSNSVEPGLADGGADL